MGDIQDVMVVENVRKEKYKDIYAYPDGKKVFRCGGEPIELPPISSDNIAEIKQLMKKQDDYFLEKVECAK